MLPQNESELYLMVGEIRSDVKKLLENDVSTQQRVGSLEKKIWTASGAAAFLGMFVTTAAAKIFGHW